VISFNSIEIYLKNLFFHTYYKSINDEFKFEPPGRKELIYNEKLSMSATLFKDKQTNNYQDKPIKLYLEVYTSKGYKPAGFSELNLKDYVNLKEYQMLDIKVLKCADKNSTINIKIKSHHSIDSENLY